ncbi:MAG TPA: CGNR zinc finger domain-containing protein [Candidatus Rubrimentiphilum sp.]|nr:CGNR zinc finger domain-containing protein [Candidatus Rubrimentiphilum sp.]
MDRAEHALAIAFLNAKGAFEDPVAAGRWWAGARDRAQAFLLAPGSPKPRFDAGLAAELRTLHQAAREAAAGDSVAPEPALAALSGGLARGSLKLTGTPPSLVFSASDGPGAVLFPLAHAVATLLAANDGRLRRCAGKACAAYFWDGTKNGSRRWCRLSCMERARAPRRRLQR